MQDDGGPGGPNPAVAASTGGLEDCADDEDDEEQKISEMIAKSNNGSTSSSALELHSNDAPARAAESALVAPLAAPLAAPLISPPIAAPADKSDDGVGKHTFLGWKCSKGGDEKPPQEIAVALALVMKNHYQTGPARSPPLSSSSSLVGLWRLRDSVMVCTVSGKLLWLDDGKQMIYDG